MINKTPKKFCDYGDILTLQEVADLCQLTKQTVYAMVRHGDIPAVKLGGYRISKKWLQSQVESGESVSTNDVEDDDFEATELD